MEKADNGVNVKTHESDTSAQVLQNLLCVQKVAGAVIELRQEDIQNIPLPQAVQRTDQISRKTKEIPLPQAVEKISQIPNDTEIGGDTQNIPELSHKERQG